MQLTLKSMLSMNLRWIGFYAMIIIAWLALFAMVLGSDAARFARIYGAEFWAEICAVGTNDAGYGAVFAMWALMSAAMMAPTFAPALRTYDDLSRTGAASKYGFSALLLGYLAVWLGFSALAALLQMALADAGVLTREGTVSGLVGGGVLIAAGLYQFSRLKTACLTQCREPFAYFMQHWDRGPLTNGVHLGLVCIGCCWALMLLGFVGGVMNLIWMGGATLLMALEKMPQIGRYVTAPLGILMILAGFAMATFAI